MNFDKASQSFKERNRHLGLLPGEKTKLAGNVDARRGTRKPYENQNRTSIQNPKCPEPVKALGCPDARETKCATRPIVRITSCRIRLLDKDNLYRGCKSLLDALRYTGAIPGDSEMEIDYQARQIKVAHRREEKTVIELEL